jgi:adenosylcobinamide-phosphate synthase
MQFLTIPLSIFFDLLLGDPPNRFHPTAWMGNLIAFLMRFRPRGNRFAELIFGALILFIGLTLTIGAGWTLSVFASRFLFGILIEALALKLTISLRGLDRAAREVQSALEAQNLPEARRLLSWHLVSRDTANLTESQVAAAAIESVAENASDGIVAPLFFYALGGLPLAFAYRFVNTADSMLGYRDAECEWIGKIPARLDDVLNFIPARLTGLFICAATGFRKQAWAIMRRDSQLTASPNAGVPMSAMAGALGVELEKIGHYKLGANLRAPTMNDLRQARRLLYFSVALAVVCFELLSFRAERGIFAIISKTLR